MLTPEPAFLGPWARERFKRILIQLPFPSSLWGCCYSRSILWEEPLGHALGNIPGGGPMTASRLLPAISRFSPEWGSTGSMLTSSVEFPACTGRGMRQAKPQSKQCPPSGENLEVIALRGAPPGSFWHCWFLAS